MCLFIWQKVDRCLELTLQPAPGAAEAMLSKEFTVLVKGPRQFIHSETKPLRGCRTLVATEGKFPGTPEFPSWQGVSERGNTNASEDLGSALQ